MLLLLQSQTLKLVDPQDQTLLHAQPVASIRVWGVGRDSGRWGRGAKGCSGSPGELRGQAGVPMGSAGPVQRGGCARTGVLACRVQALLQSWGVGWVPELGGGAGASCTCGVLGASVRIQGVCGVSVL